MVIRDPETITTKGEINIHQRWEVCREMCKTEILEKSKEGKRKMKSKKSTKPETHHSENQPRDKKGRFIKNKKKK